MICIIFDDDLSNVKEEIVDAIGNDGNASMPEQVNRSNSWREMMMMMIMMKIYEM
jgi:predicted transcriptional regulator YheO